MRGMVIGFVYIIFGGIDICCVFLMDFVIFVYDFGFCYFERLNFF